MTYLLLISLLTASCLRFGAGQTPCTTPHGQSGTCVFINRCKSILQLMRSRSANYNLLMNSFCGNEPSYVCCPPVVCTTPDGEQGTCVELQSCPLLSDLLQSYPENNRSLHLQRYSCEGLAEGSVCCSAKKNADNNVDCKLTAIPPDPSSECCGEDASNGVRIVGGEAAAIDEHPWMALLEYNENSTIKTRCGGALISGQYVLTAGHCVNKQIPISVILGEYDTNNPGEDRVVAPGGGFDHTDGAESVPIKKIVIHPGYSQPLKRDDIALIQLVRIVQFTDFIRPICLPTVDFTTKATDNVELCTSGWGMTETRRTSNIKLKIRLPYVTNEDCQLGYNSYIKPVTITDRHICAGGVYGMDTCQGDSGGPLMRQIENKYELVGIVSFGPSQCGSGGIAGVYTKVFDYLPWIRSEIIA